MSLPSVCAAMAHGVKTRHIDRTHTHTRTHAPSLHRQPPAPRLPFLAVPPLLRAPLLPASPTTTTPAINQRGRRHNGRRSVAAEPDHPHPPGHRGHRRRGGQAPPPVEPALAHPHRHPCGPGGQRGRRAGQLGGGVAAGEHGGAQHQALSCFFFFSVLSFSFLVFCVSCLCHWSNVASSASCWIFGGGAVLLYVVFGLQDVRNKEGCVLGWFAGGRVRFVASVSGAESPGSFRLC